MIRKQKVPLSRLYGLVVFSFLLPLAGFFVYATRNSTTYFFLTAALGVVIFFLISFHRRLQKKQSQIALLKEEYFEQTNVLKARVKREWETIESLHLKIINYSHLKELTEKLSTCLGLQETSQTLSSEVSRLFGSREVTVILYLFHSTTGELGIFASQKGQMKVNLKAKKGDIFDQFVIKTMHPLLVEDVTMDFRFDLEKISSEERRPLRSLMVTPLIVGERMLGILRIDSPTPKFFATDDLRFLRAIADVASIAIENAQLYERLEDMAIKDSLTGLYLRRHMLERLQEEIFRETRLNHPLAFLMIDLDHFKQYNDSFGHIAGDMVLKSVGRLMQEAFDVPGDLICRWGGEEFCIALPNCTRSKAIAQAEALRQTIEDSPILLRRRKTSVTISIGIACFPGDGHAKEDLINKADQRLYRAKEEGRNRVCAL